MVVNASIQGDILSALTASSLQSINQPLVLLLIINNSVLGIVTSLFLKKLNSILKAFASALELVITAVTKIQKITTIIIIIITIIIIMLPLTRAASDWTR